MNIDPDDGDDALELMNRLKSSDGSLEIDDGASGRKLYLQMIGIFIIVFALVWAFLKWHKPETEINENVQRMDEARTKTSIEHGYAAYIQEFPKVGGDLETRGIETESD